MESYFHDYITDATIKSPIKTNILLQNEVNLFIPFTIEPFISDW